LNVILPVGLTPLLKVAVSVAESGKVPRVIVEGETTVTIDGPALLTVRVSPSSPHAVA
jgi:hypothetical protein